MAKTIGGISIDRWKMAFAEVADIAISKDYFSDILFFDLYPNTHEEAAAVREANKELANEIYNTKWEFVSEAFKEIFGISRNELYNE